MTERATRAHRTGASAATMIAVAAGVTLLASGCSAPGVDTPAAGAQPGPRLAVATEDAIAVLDAESLELIEELPVEEPVRLSAGGDGTHLIARTSGGFQLLDARVPELTDVVFPAKQPGHVVVHGDSVALFDDGAGETRVIETAALSERPEGGGLPQHAVHSGAEAHHGVSVPLDDGTLLTTVGTDKDRTGVAHVERHDDHWHSISESDECPGVHGEAVAADEAVVFGCKDGVLLFRDGEFTKLAAPAPGGKTGSVFASEASAIAVADFATDSQGESLMIAALTLVDTAAGTQRVIELPAEARVTFRGVARGDDGLAYLLSADGAIRVLNPDSGEIEAEHPVIDPWEEPADWQDAMPALLVDGSTGYVTDPAATSVHAVDLKTGKRVASAKLGGAAAELALATGRS